MTLTPRRLTVGLLLALQFIASISMSMVFSLAPTITAFFGIPASNATFLNIGFVAAGLLSPLFGYAADRQGAKPVLIVGTLIFVLGHGLAAMSTSVWLYFTARFLVGLGYSAMLGLIVSYLSKLLDHSRMGSISAFLKLAFALGVFVSPIMAGTLVDLLGFQVLYLAMTALGSLILLGLFWIPSIELSHEGHVTLQEVKDLFKNKTFLSFLGVSLATALPGTVFFNFLSVFLSEKGYVQGNISLIYSMIGLGSIASAFVIFFLNKKLGMIRIFRYGIWITLIGLIPMMTLNPLLIIVLAPFWSLGYDAIVGLINPVLAIEFPRHSGTVIMSMSLLNAVYGILINVSGPWLYQSFGFMGMLVIGILGTGLGTLSLHHALKKV